MAAGPAARTVHDEAGAFDHRGSAGCARRPSARARASSSSFVIDLTGVTFMGRRGLSVLVRAHHLITVRHGRPHLTGVRPHLRRLLHLTGLDRTFSVQDARVSGVSAPCQ